MHDAAFEIANEKTLEKIETGPSLSSESRKDALAGRPRDVSIKNAAVGT